MTASDRPSIPSTNPWREFVTHYLGFPLGSALNGAVDAVVAKRKKAAAKGAGEDKKANVDAALKMHSGE